MKSLRIVLAALALLAACDAPGPSAPELPVRSLAPPAPNPENATLCDSVCRSPFMGGGGG